MNNIYKSACGKILPERSDEELLRAVLDNNKEEKRMSRHFTKNLLIIPATAAALGVCAFGITAASRYFPLNEKAAVSYEPLDGKADEIGEKVNEAVNSANEALKTSTKRTVAEDVAYFCSDPKRGGCEYLAPDGTAMSSPSREYDYAKIAGEFDEDIVLELTDNISVVFRGWYQREQDMACVIYDIVFKDGVVPFSEGSEWRIVTNLQTGFNGSPENLFPMDDSYSNAIYYPDHITKVMGVYGRSYARGDDITVYGIYRPNGENTLFDEPKTVNIKIPFEEFDTRVIDFDEGVEVDLLEVGKGDLTRIKLNQWFIYYVFDFSDYDEPAYKDEGFTSRFPVKVIFKDGSAMSFDSPGSSFYEPDARSFTEQIFGFPCLFELDDVKSVQIGDTVVNMADGSVEKVDISDFRRLTLDEYNEKYPEDKVIR